MGVKYIPDGQDFQFPSDFGFTKSAAMPRATSVPGRRMRQGGKVKGYDAGGPVDMPEGAAPVVPPGAGPMPPAGGPPGAGPGGGPLSHATITLPVADAAKMAAGLTNVGRAQGAAAATKGMAAPPPPMAAAAPVGGPPVAGMKKGGHITTKERKALPSSDFALPGKGKGAGGKGPGAYPIDTPARARNALSRAAQNASPAEQATIRRKVHAKYPGIGKSKE